ncbi:hypothetical protein L3X38_010119 [Prunus dulcis]|uniref:DUF4283 domain-containing protein n=1 Tax=Prunus dulcis TaxID=3755 RepID=A0AAD4WGJ7_PRUDU|nr:hypothetical protein L3X38_010119 [Prunus dulcis]
MSSPRLRSRSSTRADSPLGLKEMKPKSPPLILRLVSKLNETFCLVGKVFGVPVNSRVIRHRLKSEWKNLQGEVSIDHIGQDWYKVEFNAEADVSFVLDNRPWFVQGQIFALQHWTPDFSPFHAVVTSIVGWVRIPFLPLHYKDPEVLYDLVSILGILLVWTCSLRRVNRPINVDYFAEENSDQGEKVPTEVQDPGWTVVANSDHISKGKGRAVVIAPAHSQEGSSAFTGFAYKSPKKRTRDEVEVEENYAPSVEMHGEYLRETKPSVGNTQSPNP